MELMPMSKVKNTIAVLALSFAVATVLAATPLVTYAEEGVSSSSEEEPVSKENSWRYEDGEPIVGSDEAAACSDSEDDGIDLQSVGGMPSNATARGIDVSGYQKNIDWQAVKSSGIDFAILKIGNIDESETDGWYTDSCFVRNMTECERLGIPYGVYVYAYGKSTWAYENGADHIISLLKGHHPSLPVYLDLEDDSINPGQTSITNQQLLQFSRAFCDRISAAGYYPGIYSGAGWFKYYLTDSAYTSGEWSIWTAQYPYAKRYDDCIDESESGDWPEYPARGKYDFWQYSSRAEVPGISGNVDINYCYVDLSASNNSTGSISFSDVNSDTPHSADIVWLGENGISTGWAKFGGIRTFQPYAKIARADMAAFLYRLAGSPEYEAPSVSPFKDVSASTSHYKEICWLASKGISEGWTEADGSKTFRPYSNTARADMAAFLYRLAGSPEFDESSFTGFSDVDSSTPHYKEICWLYSAGISTGWNEADGSMTFRAWNNIARADMAAFLHRMRNAGLA